MIAIPKEIIDQVEFVDGEARLKAGASEEQQAVFELFLIQLKNTTQIIEDGDTLVITTA